LFDGSVLHADGETIPVLVGQAAPSQRIECVGEADDAVRLAATDQPVFRIAAAEIDDRLGDAAASPVAAAVVAGCGGPEAGAVAEDIEVLVQDTSLYTTRPTSSGPAKFPFTFNELAWLL